MNKGGIKMLHHGIKTCYYELWNHRNKFRESERDIDFYTIKQYTIYLLKSYNPPMKKNVQEQEISNTTK